MMILAVPSTGKHSEAESLCLCFVCVNIIQKVSSSASPLNT